MLSLKSDLLQWLRKYNIKPNQKLGQCFLVSEKALSKIIAMAEIKAGDKVLEIGSGTGVLTQKLLEGGAEVLAVEKDSRLALVLHERFEKDRKIGKLKIIQSDFLDLDFPKIFGRFGWKKNEYKVVANLPYQITSPALERLVERDFLPFSIVVTIQKEVAERICAKPGEMSSLAVLIQNCTQKCTLVSKFPRSFFYPIPKVDSALLKLEGLAYPEQLGIKFLRKVIHAGFAQKRKKLKNNLQKVFPIEAINKIWEEMGISENARAQEIEGKKWVEIAKKLGCLLGNIE